MQDRIIFIAQDAAVLVQERRPVIVAGGAARAPLLHHSFKPCIVFTFWDSDFFVFQAWVLPVAEGEQNGLALNIRSVRTACCPSRAKCFDFLNVPLAGTGSGLSVAVWR